MTASFWDTQTSGKITSSGGTGLTTEEMQTASTFLDAGWDFMGETDNGTEDIRGIVEGRDYLRLMWEHWAYSPGPPDGSTEVPPSTILTWRAANEAKGHDVYFGQDDDVVSNATRESVGIYRGWQPADETSYDPGILEWGTTYYWRIDETNESDSNSPWKGDVWSFTVADAIGSPDPQDGARDVIQPTILSWVPGGPGLEYDVYIGIDEYAVANATPEDVDLYFGRQSSERTTCEPAYLEWGQTYYWRVDGVNDADPNSPWKGEVWSFTAADYAIVLVVDDFESYTKYLDSREAIFQMWIDGIGFEQPEPNSPGNGTGSYVGHDLWQPKTPYDQIMETQIVHGGAQSMPYYYDNDGEPYYSEAERTWETPQDWTVDDADTLTLYFHGEPDNDPEPLYVTIWDSTGHVARVTHPDADAVLASEWHKWNIALAELQAAGVDVTSVRKMIIGLGNRDNPQPGGTGLIYIDDIAITRRMP